MPARRPPGTETPFIRLSSPLEHPSSQPSPSVAWQSPSQEPSLLSVMRLKRPARDPRHPPSHVPDLQPQPSIAGATGAALATSSAASQPQASVSQPHFDFLRSQLPSLFNKFFPTRGITIPFPLLESSSQASSSHVVSSHASVSHASVSLANILRNKPIFLCLAHGSHSAVASSATGSCDASAVSQALQATFPLHPQALIRA